MKTLRYRIVGSILYCGVSLFLFGVVVFALMRTADHLVPISSVGDWTIIVALIAAVVATGAVFSLMAWGLVSDPKSRLGAWVQKKPLVENFLIQAGMLVLSLFLYWLLGIR